MHSKLADRLNLAVPIIQAPMAGVSTPKLAAEVCKGGGMGSLGLGAVDAEGAREAIRAARALGACPLNANFFCHQPEEADPHKAASWIADLRQEFARFDATPPSELREIYHSFLNDTARVAMLLQERPEVVSFHFGLPSASVIAALKEAGILLLASATNVAEALACVSAGMDGIVVQGIEAGGHRGIFDPLAPDEALPTLDLVARLKSRTDLPLIAAGGLMDGADCARALQAGADMVQLGTAFVLCPETSADDGYRAAMASDAANHTGFTSAISGRPARALPNAFTAWGADRQDESPGYPHTYDAGKALHAAAKAKGDHSYGAHWAGSGAARAQSLPATELMAQLIAQLAAEIRART